MNIIKMTKKILIALLILNASFAYGNQKNDDPFPLEMSLRYPDDTVIAIEYSCLDDGDGAWLSGWRVNLGQRRYKYGNGYYDLRAGDNTLCVKYDLSGSSRVCSGSASLKKDSSLGKSVEEDFLKYRKIDLYWVSSDSWKADEFLDTWDLNWFPFALENSVRKKCNLKQDKIDSHLKRMIKNIFD